MSFPIIISDHLSLRSWHSKHAAELFALVDQNRTYLHQWLPWVPDVQTVKDSEKFIEESLQKWRDQTGLELAIWHNGTIVGCIGLHNLNREQNRTTIGYWLSENAQGNGIMTASVQALTEYCFETLNFDQVEISANRKNVKSRAIPERLGFVLEGTLHQPEIVNGEFEDTVGYRLSKSAWEKVPLV